MRYATLTTLALLALAGCSVPDWFPERQTVELDALPGSQGSGSVESEELYAPFFDWEWDVDRVPGALRFEVEGVDWSEAQDDDWIYDEEDEDDSTRGRVYVDYWIRVRDHAVPGVYRFRATVTLKYLIWPEQDIELDFVVRVRGGWRWLRVRQEIPREATVVPVEIDSGS